MIALLLVLAAGFAAFSNGANANCKGVASLYGDDTASLRTAIVWGTLTTLLGSLTALVLGARLMKSFSGHSLVSNELVAAPEFACAAAIGAASTGFLAVRLAFPVSTTHALLGALLGTGLAAGSSIGWSALGTKFVLPLVIGPLAAAISAMIIYSLIRVFFPRIAPEGRNYVMLHYFVTGAASFARGLNDTPKVAALFIASPYFNATGAILTVAILILLGGLLDSRNVAETIGKKVTRLKPTDGLAAGLNTAVLVSAASLFGLPMSTTHVSVGSLVGIGTLTGEAHRRKIGEIALAWLATVPCGAVLGAAAYAIVSRL